MGSLHHQIPFQTAFDYVQLSVEKRVTNPLWKVRELLCIQSGTGGGRPNARRRRRPGSRGADWSQILPSPTFNRHLKVCNDFVADIIKQARNDPNLAERNDLLAHCE